MRNYAMLVALILILSLAGSEAMLRVYATIDRDFGRQLREFDSMNTHVEVYGELGYRQKPNRRSEYTNGTIATSNNSGYRGPLADTSNPSGVFRIVLLGGSTTHGWGVNDNQTIGAYMREILAARHPNRAIEVINFAFDGYDTTQLVERFTSDGLPLKPDLVIINTGINDVRNARFENLRPKDIRTVVWRHVLEQSWREERDGDPSLLVWIKHYLYTARLPGFIRHRWERRRAHQEGLEIIPNPQAACIFEQNLRKLGAMIHAQGGMTLYSNAPSSLAMRYNSEDTSPSGYWIRNAATTQEFRNVLVDRTRKVVAELSDRGWAVGYVSHALSDSMFIDDAHLTPEGNRQLAKDFVDAIEPVLQLETRPPEATAWSQ